MSPKHWKISIIIVMLIPLLTSCWNAEELDKMNYVHSIGIDFDNNKYTVYLQIVNFSFLTKQAAPSSQNQTQAVVGIGKGTTVVDAIRDVYKKSSRRIFWGHLSSIVFSERALKQGIQQPLDLFSRYHETRYTLWMYATNTSLEKVLTTYPPTEISEVYALLGDPRDTLKQSSFIKPMRMFEVIRSLNEPGNTVILPKLSLSEQKWNDGQTKTPALTMAKAVMITKNKFEGSMSETDSKGLLFFERARRAPRFFVYIKIGKNQHVTLTIQKPKEKFVAHYKNGRPTFDCTVTVKPVVEELDKKISTQVLHEKAVKHIKSLVNQTYQTALKNDIDIYSLSHTFYKRYPKTWRKIQHDGNIPLDKDSLHIHVNLKFLNSYKAEYTPLFEK